MSFATPHSPACHEEGKTKFEVYALLPLDANLGPIHRRPCISRSLIYVIYGWVFFLTFLNRKEYVSRVCFGGVFRGIKLCFAPLSSSRNTRLRSMFRGGVRGMFRVMFRQSRTSAPYLKLSRQKQSKPMYTCVIYPNVGAPNWPSRIPANTGQLYIAGIDPMVL